MLFGIYCWDGSNFYYAINKVSVTVGVTLAYDKLF